jgi:hypothetical protein
MSTDNETMFQSIRRVADEIRVRIHLAGMDAREVWAGLEPKVKQLEHLFDRATTDASSDMNALATTVQTELRHLREKLFDAEPKGN